MYRGANGCQRFEWSSCLHLQGQAIQKDRLTLKKEGLRSFETSGSTRPTTKRHNSDNFNLQYSEIRWPLSVLSVLADLQKGPKKKKSEKLVREIRIHAFVTGWSCISDGENKNPPTEFWCWYTKYIYCHGVFIKDVK